MNLIAHLKSRLQRDICLMEVAEDVADRSFDLVWQKVCGRVLNMCPSEARGYARASARSILQREIARRQIAGGWEGRVYDLASNVILRRVANQTHAVRVREQRRRAA